MQSTGQKREEYLSYARERQGIGTKTKAEKKGEETESQGGNTKDKLDGSQSGVRTKNGQKARGHFVIHSVKAKNWGGKRDARKSFR